MAVFAAYLGSLVPALGWTLAHFVWQGALVALVLELLLKTCRTAQARHNLALGGLLLMAALPVATFAWLQGDVRIEFVPAGFAGLAASQALTWEKVAVAAWLTGVAALGFRTAGGLLLVERLRQGARPLPPAWAARCRLLQMRMAGSLNVAFAQSRAVAAPLVAGWLKPMVLIPAAALARMPADQLEALILHELAHVRRLDAFANLIQTVVETALFYHPAVWWVSRRIRVERENCCDDLAVAAIQDPALYVRALRSMEALRPAGASVLAANGGDLKSRAARILGLARAPARPALSRIAAVLILTLTGAAVTHSAAVQADPTQPPAVVAPAQGASATPPPMPVPPIHHLPRVILAEASGASPPSTLWTDPAMAARIRALGPMPPDSQPAAQAAWRLKRYDLDLETDRRHAETDRRAIAAERARVGAMPLADPNDGRRLHALNNIDMSTSREGLTEVHAQSVKAARAAVATAEAVRRATAAGKASREAAAAAQADAAHAERLADTAAQAIIDQAFSTIWSMTRLDQEIAKTTPGYPHPEVSEEINRLATLKERARLEAVAYSAVRAAVEAGKRPAADLDAAGQSLKTAQVALYDLQALQHDRLAKLTSVCTRGVAGPDGTVRPVPQPSEACPGLPDLPHPDFPVLPPREAVAEIPAGPVGDPATILTRLKDLGPMPPDSEPIAQAAWRAKHYAWKIENDRAQARSLAEMAARSRSRVETLGVSAPDDPQRLFTLAGLAQTSTREAMNELDAQAEQAAANAFAHAEAVRLAVAAGHASAADLAAARGQAADADRAVHGISRALVDEMGRELKVMGQATRDLSLRRPGQALVPQFPDWEASEALEQRVRLESIAYQVVREGVEAGRRPPSDLDAAAGSLKAAQTLVYDQLEALMRQTTAQREQLRKTSEKSMTDSEARLTDLRSELATATGDSRERLEARIQISEQMLASSKAMLALMNKPQPQFKRPELPVLPPSDLTPPVD